MALKLYDNEDLQVQARALVFCLERVYKHLPWCMWSRGISSSIFVNFR